MSCKDFNCIQNILLSLLLIFGNQNLPKYLWAFSLLCKFSPNSLDKLFSADGLLWIACEFFTLASALCLLGGLISSWAEWLKCLQGRKNEHRILSKKQCVSRTNIFTNTFGNIQRSLTALWMLDATMHLCPQIKLISLSQKRNCEPLLIFSSHVR